MTTVHLDRSHNGRRPSLLKRLAAPPPRAPTVIDIRVANYLMGINRHRVVTWIVYRSPADSPGLVVARPWVTASGAGRTSGLPYQLAASSLEALREQLPAGLVRRSREASDDPAVIERWSNAEEAYAEAGEGAPGRKVAAR